METWTSTAPQTPRAQSWTCVSVSVTGAGADPDAQLCTRSEQTNLHALKHQPVTRVARAASCTASCSQLACMLPSWQGRLQVRAFPGDDALRNFRDWVNLPPAALMGPTGQALEGALGLTFTGACSPDCRSCAASFLEQPRPAGCSPAGMACRRGHGAGQTCMPSAARLFVDDSDQLHIVSAMYTARQSCCRGRGGH